MTPAMLSYLSTDEGFLSVLSFLSALKCRGRIIANDDLGRMWNEAAMTYFKVLSQNLPGKNDELHEEPQFE
jgi:hypothetical protein